MKFTDDLPSTIATAIVDKHHHGVTTDQSLRDHTLKEGCEALYAVAKHFFFIITW
jgi:hypothetical protein